MESFSSKNQQINDTASLPRLQHSG